MAPDSKEMAVVRNYLEHRYLKVVEGDAETLNSPPSKWDFRMDVLARFVGRAEFERMTLQILRLARAGLIYTSLAVHAEERERAKARPEGAPIMPMISDRWEDEWKH